MHSREILPKRKITSIAAMLALLWIFGVSGTANAAGPIVEFTKVKQGEVFPWPLVVIEGKTTEGVMERLQSIHEDFKCLYIKHQDVVNKYPVYKGHFKAVVKLHKGKNSLRFMTAPDAADGVNLELNYAPDTNKRKVRINYYWVEEDKGRFLIPATATEPARLANLESAKKRQALMMMIVQSNYGMLMEQRGYGKKSINPEYDDAGDVIVHDIMIPGTWDSMGSQIAAIRKARNEAFPGVEFKHALTEQPDIVTINFGHSRDLKGNKYPGLSIGGAWLLGPRLPYFPETLEELNWKLVDPKDRNPAGVSQASNRLGGYIHELGHTIGFQHTMARDIMNGNGGQGYKNFMLLDHMRSYGGPNGDGDLGPVLVSDDLFPVISHQTAQHFLLSPWCTEGPRYGDIDQNEKPVLVTEDEENFIVEWETGVRMVEFCEFRHISPFFTFYPDAVKLPSGDDKLPTKVVISKKQVLEGMIAGRKKDVNRKWITSEFDGVDISVDHIRNLYVTDGYNRRRFSLFRDAKHLSPRMTAIMLLRGQIEDRIAANYSSEVADELKKMGGTVVHGVFLDKRIKMEARRIILAGRKQREAAKKNGASKEDLAALQKEAEGNEQRALEKWAAKIKAEAATKKATEPHH